MDVRFTRNYDGDDVYVTLEAGNVVGAVPLFSPTSGLLDPGLARNSTTIPVAGVGPMLAEMGWRVAPIPLRLPLLKRSERKVPTWVISSMVLARLRALLDALARRFEVITEVKVRPARHHQLVVVRNSSPGDRTVFVHSLFISGFTGRPAIGGCNLVRVGKATGCPGFAKRTWRICSSTHRVLR